MYFAEHRYLGDDLQLPGHDAASPSNKSAKQNPFTLENGLITTYGEINGFSGDYFGLLNPISLQSTPEEKILKFRRWFELLNKEKNGKPKAEALRTELKSLNDKADIAISSGKSGELAVVYKQNPLNISKLNQVSNTPAVGASFMELLQTNEDHFGPEARDVYNVGHAVALQTAAKGDLQKAYAYNAFADHFLEDSFASGHMRTPRKQLYDVGKSLPSLISAVVNASSNVMHEEDGELGLWAQSPSGERWQSFGDGRLPEHSAEVTTTALVQCRKALEQSVKEVYEAYTTKLIISEAQFEAWQHTPILETISAQPENHKPLIVVQSNAIRYRTGGSQSGTYKTIASQTDWIAFYSENFGRIDDQVRVWLKQNVPWLAPLL